MPHSATLGEMIKTVLDEWGQSNVITKDWRQDNGLIRRDITHAETGNKVASVIIDDRNYVQRILYPTLWLN
jgi:hypothetical protein